MFSLLQAIGSDCWQSSELMTVLGDSFPSTVMESHPALTTYALLLCLLYFLIFVENSFIALLISWRSLFNPLALEDTMANKNLTYAINNTTLLCLPLLSLAFYFLNVSRLNFIFILAMLAGFGLLHFGLMQLTGWLKRCPEMIRTLQICDRIYVIVFTTVALLVLLAGRLPFDLPGRACSIILAVTLLILFILLSVRSFIIFKENNCSFLFWFLYLCTLEILPLVLIICALTGI